MVSVTNINEVPEGYVALEVECVDRRSNARSQPSNAPSTNTLPTRASHPPHESCHNVTSSDRQEGLAWGNPAFGRGGAIRENRAVANASSYLDTELRDLLDEIAADTPAPAGGSVAAFVVAMAAGLVAMAGRLSKRHWDGAGDAVGRAEQLRSHVAPLAQADAAAYEEVLTAQRLPRDLEPEVRAAALENALSRAADIPLLIAEAGADVAELGALLAERGNPNLRADAAAATVFAAAGARAAANLVEVNLGREDLDDRIVRAHQLVAAAEACVDRALAAGRP
jgi:formiminotetrahydrofolate cyclodeaminase